MGDPHFRSCLISSFSLLNGIHLSSLRCSHPCYGRVWGTKSDDHCHRRGLAHRLFFVAGSSDEASAPPLQNPSLKCLQWTLMAANILFKCHSLRLHVQSDVAKKFSPQGRLEVSYRTLKENGGSPLFGLQATCKQ
jgi:hypothetical protein